MSYKITFITCESRDGEVQKLPDEVFEEGDSINNHQWKDSIEGLGFKVEEIKITDEQMEEGEY